jgi:hypothetical protein
MLLAAHWIEGVDWLAKTVTTKLTRDTMWWSNFLGQVDMGTSLNRRGKTIDDKKAPTI